jgi:hypothetical protein
VLPLELEPLLALPPVQVLLLEPLLARLLLMRRP